MAERSMVGPGFRDVVIPQRSGYSVTVEPGYVVLREIGHDTTEIVTLTAADARAVAQALTAAARWLEDAT